MAKTKLPLTAERLKEVLFYDPETGVFTWRVFRGGTAKVGTIAGHCQRKERGGGLYLSIRVDWKRYQAHRLAWLYMTGEWPSLHIDHIDNKDTLNNRWANLRLATPLQSAQNRSHYPSNRSGFKGVVARDNQWAAFIKIKGKQLYLGLFKTAELAHEAYCDAAKRLHGEFARFD